MISSALRLQPRLFSCWIKHTRNHCQPTIDGCNTKFKITINVHNFNKEEIKVQARPEFVVVEGRQDKKDTHCHYVRRFERKFKLPADCNIRDMKSELSSEGILTITAPRNTGTPPCSTQDLQTNTCDDRCKDVPVLNPDELIKIPVQSTEDVSKRP